MALELQKTNYMPKYDIWPCAKGYVRSPPSLGEEAIDRTLRRKTV